MVSTYSISLCLLQLFLLLLVHSRYVQGKRHKKNSASKKLSRNNITSAASSSWKPWIVFKNVSSQAGAMSRKLGHLQREASQAVHLHYSILSYLSYSQWRLTYCATLSILQLKVKSKSIETNRHPLLCVGLVHLTPFVISTQLANVMTTKDVCHWAFIAYYGNATQLSEFRERVLELNATGQCGCELRSTHCTIWAANVHHLLSAVALAEVFQKPIQSYCDFVAKARLYPYLLPVVHKYQRLWILDEDLLLNAFDIRCLLNVLELGSYPEAPPLIAQPTLFQRTQSEQVFARDFWFYRNNTAKKANAVLAVHKYIEQQVLHNMNSLIDKDI